MFSLASLGAPTLSTTPSGAYSGSKSVLGLTINVNVNVNDGSTMDFHLDAGGQVTIDCKAEKYAYDGASSITLPDQGTAGDCIHDAEAAQHVTLVGVDYDAAADTTTIRAKYTVVPVTIELTKSGAAPAARFGAMAPDHEGMFAEYETYFAKSYTAAERPLRFAAFVENLAAIEARNADGSLGHHWVGKFADLSKEEFKARYLGYKPKADASAGQEEDDSLEAALVTPASSIDWRNKKVGGTKVLTPVKDQKQCGSCWAFSATEQIETDVAIATGQLLDLSPQQIVSCDHKDLGCNGGNTETAYDYVAQAGLETDKEYPYSSGSGRSGTCKAKSGKSAVQIGGYKTVSKKKSSEGKMVTQIAKSPISVCVDASSWQTYSKGVVGRSCGSELDHCVQAVGLNVDDDSKPYWIVRNSWNTDWGEGGYIYVQQGIDACGIAKDATVVTGAKIATAVEASSA